MLTQRQKMCMKWNMAGGCLVMLLACIIDCRVNQVFADDSCVSGCVACQQCGCQMKVEDIKVSHHCWQVETKTVCIPPITFPWQKRCSEVDCVDPGCVVEGCVPEGCLGDACVDSCGMTHGRWGSFLDWLCAAKSCSRTRCVKSLKKETYECPACKYTWEPSQQQGCGSQIDCCVHQ